MGDPKWLTDSDERAKAATPGEWFHGDWSGQCFDEHQHSRETCNYKYTKNVGAPAVGMSGQENHHVISWGDVSKCNAAHIAANNPDHVLKLNALIREMAEALEAYLNAGFKEARREASDKAKAALARFQEGP